MASFSLLDIIGTAEEWHTDEAEGFTAVELFTDETATAEVLHSDEAGVLRIRLRSRYFPPHLEKLNTGMCSD